MKISNKLIILSTIMIIIPVLVVGMIGYSVGKEAVISSVEEGMENQAKQIALDSNTVYEIAQSKVTSDLSLANQMFYSYGNPYLDTDGNMVLVDIDKEEAVQKKVNSDLLVAHAIMYSKGNPVLEKSNTITVDAQNQITKEVKQVQIGTMKIGGKNVLYNYDIVDEIKSTSGVETATIFQVIPDGLLRISTNVMNLDGTRAVGTYIPTDSPVYKSVMNKATYKGRAFVVNAWYQTAYEPIFNNNNEVIGVLYVGVKESKHIVNNNYEIVDNVKSLVDGTATVFQLKDFEGDHEGDLTTKDWTGTKAMYRISTNVMKLDGTRAIGTIVSKPVYDTIMNGESFYGRAFVVNAWYLTAYEPIIDSNSNEIIGILYVGVKEDLFQEKLKENMARQVIGKSGYIFILDENGNYVLSKGRERDGENIWEAEDKKGNKIIQEMVSNAMSLEEGETKTIYYSWKNKGDLTARDSLVAYAYYPEWGWIVASSAYTDEFFVELNKARNVIFGVSLLSILLGGLIIYIFSIKITGPLIKMSEAGNKVAEGKLDTELPIITTNDEVQDISETMNLLVGAVKYLKKENEEK